MARYVRMIDGMTNVTVDDEMSFTSNFLNDEGIVVQSGTDLQVQAQSTPDLTVKVKAGTCYVKRDAWTANSGGLKFWEVVIDADENVTIPANNSGSTIRRIVCVKVDTGVAPDANASNVATLVVVSGTAGGGDPTIPDNHLSLGRIIHLNADTSIASADINDLRSEVSLNITADNPASGSGASVYLASAQSITNGALTKVTFDTEAYDIGNEFASNKFTATTAGKYLVTFTPTLQSLTGGKILSASIYKNGSAVVNATFHAGSNNNLGSSMAAILNLAATDYVEFYVVHDDTVPKSLSGGATGTVAMIQRLT